MTLKFDGWPWKTIGHLFYATSSFVQHFVAIGEFKLELQSGNAQSGSNSTIFSAVWPWNLTDDLEKQQGTSPKQHQAICIISSSYANSNWSYSPETAKLGRDLCDLDLWPLTLTFCMDVTLVRGDNVTIRWWEHSQKGVTDRQTDGRTDRRTENTIHRAAWSQLKTWDKQWTHKPHLVHQQDNSLPTRIWRAETFVEDGGSMVWCGTFACQLLENGKKWSVINSL